MIDRNDAPEGYEARAATQGCEGCQLKFGSLDCDQADCTAFFRKDRHSVIFVKRKPRLVATGGRRPTPPEWAKKYRTWGRDKQDSGSWPLARLPRGDLAYWRHDGSATDILFVEWLP